MVFNVGIPSEIVRPQGAPQTCHLSLVTCHCAKPGGRFRFSTGFAGFAGFRKAARSAVQKEIGDVGVTDGAFAHVEAVHGQEEFPVGGFEPLQRAELAGARFFRAEEVGDLDVEAPAAFVADEVDFALAQAADGDGPATAEELEVDDVFEEAVDVPAQAAADDGVAETGVGDVEFFVHGEDALADEVLPRDAREEEGFFAGGKVVEDGLDGGLAALRLEEGGNAARGEGVAAFGHHEADDAVQEVHVADLPAADHVLEEDGGVEVLEIGAGGLFVVGDLREKGDAARDEVAVEEALGVLARKEGRGRLDEFREGKGRHPDFHVASRQVGGQLARKEAGIGAGDVDVGILVQAERVHRPLPFRHIVDFVEEKMDRLPLGLVQLGLGVFVEDAFFEEAPVGIVFQVDGADACLRIPFAQFRLDEFQQDGLAAATHSGDDLDDIRSDERAHFFEDDFALDHRVALLKGFIA